jgi:hypothetical protein
MVHGVIMLKKFVLWGHHLKDYQDMFNLSDEMLDTKRVIEYGAGVTSFNAEMNEKGHSVLSVDPIYDLTLDEIKTMVEEVFDTTVAKIKANKDKYNWKSYGDITTLLAERKQGIQTFYDDFEAGKADGRYIGITEGEALQLENYAYDLALITHHLFVNFEDKGEQDHVRLIQEMVRVAGEVRIFPLLNKYGQVSQLLGPVMLALQQQDLGLEVRQVASKLQKAGNAMLRVWAVKCDVEP